MVSEETTRNRVIRIIAATRFPFVDQEDWGEGYVTIVNDEVKRRGIDTDEAPIYPSIVICRPDGRIQELADVALAKEVSPASVARWTGLWIWPAPSTWPTTSTTPCAR